MKTITPQNTITVQIHHAPGAETPQYIAQFLGDDYNGIMLMDQGISGITDKVSAAVQAMEIYRVNVANKASNQVKQPENN